MNLFNHRYLNWYNWYLSWYYWYLNWYLSWYHRYLNRGFYDHCGLCFNNFGLYNFFFHNYNFSLGLSFFSLCYGLGCSFSCLFSLNFGLFFCFGFGLCFGLSLFSLEFGL